MGLFLLLLLLLLHHHLDGGYLNEIGGKEVSQIRKDATLDHRGFFFQYRNKEVA